MGETASNAKNITKVYNNANSNTTSSNYGAHYLYKK